MRRMGMVPKADAAPFAVLEKPVKATLPARMRARVRRRSGLVGARFMSRRTPRAESFPRSVSRSITTSKKEVPSQPYPMAYRGRRESKGQERPPIMAKRKRVTRVSRAIFPATFHRGGGCVSRKSRFHRYACQPITTRKATRKKTMAWTEVCMESVGCRDGAFGPSYYLRIVLQPSSTSTPSSLSLTPSQVAGQSRILVGFVLEGSS